MHWYLVQTKPKREEDAYVNLERQGYACYLPKIKVEKIRKRARVLVDEPMFARYLFIRLGTGGKEALSISPVRSTIGVSNLVRFGNEPAKVDNSLIAYLQERETALQNLPHRLFAPGERLIVTQGPFAGLEVVYQMPDAENRALVLLDMLSKAVRMKVQVSHLRKVSAG